MMNCHGDDRKQEADRLKLQVILKKRDGANKQLQLYNATGPFHEIYNCNVPDPISPDVKACRGCKSAFWRRCLAVKTMSDHECTVAGFALLSRAVVHSRDAIVWSDTRQHSDTENHTGSAVFVAAARPANNSRWWFRHTDRWIII